MIDYDMDRGGVRFFGGVGGDVKSIDKWKG